MAYIKLKKIKTTESKVKLLSPLKFDLILDCSEEIKDEIEFAVIYSGDAYSEAHDQVLCELLIGPIPKGKVGFSLETERLDISKIPIHQLFGSTSIIITGKYKDQQFIRIGYFVNVIYPGVPNEKLAMDEEGNESEEIDEEDSLIDENSDYSEELSPSEEGKDGVHSDELLDDKEYSGKESSTGKEGNTCKSGSIDESERGGIDEKQDDKQGSQEAFLDPLCESKPRAFFDAVKEKLTNPDTKILDKDALAEENAEEVHERSFSAINDELSKEVDEDYSSSGTEEQEDRDPNDFIMTDDDEFEYLGLKLKKSEIEMEIMASSPMISVFDINWDGSLEESIEEHTIEEDFNDDEIVKRTKTKE